MSANLTAPATVVWPVPGASRRASTLGGPVSFPPDLGLDLLTGAVLVDAAGVAISVDGQTAWRQWNVLTANTQKAAFWALPRDFGVETAQALAAADPALQLARYTDSLRRALRRDRRNVRVEISVQQLGDEDVTLTIRCTAADGTVQTFSQEVSRGD